MWLDTALSGSIPPKFEHKLRRHGQRLENLFTTVVLDKDENLLLSEICKNVIETFSDEVFMVLWSVLHKNKKKLFSICPANYPRKSGTWPLQTTPQPLARRYGLVPVVAQGVVTSLIEPCINDILENQKPLSLFSSNCVPSFSCCFRFLLKFSALKKFTTTGAGYGLLTSSNPVGNIMFV